MTESYDPESVLAALEADALSDGILKDDEESLHYWMAATQLAQRLDMVDAIVKGSYADVEWVALNWPVGATEAEQAELNTAWLDKLGDAARLLMAGIAQILSAKRHG